MKNNFNISIVFSAISCLVFLASCASHEDIGPRNFSDEDLKKVIVYDKNSKNIPPHIIVKDIQYLTCTGGVGRLNEGGSAKQAKKVLKIKTKQLKAELITNFSCSKSRKDTRINCTKPLLCSGKAAKYK